MTTSVAPNGPSTIGNRRNWVFAVGLLIQIEADYAFIREISGSYPFASDQAGYLAKSYQIFEGILPHEFFRALWRGMTSIDPTGMLLPSETAVLYLFFWNFAGCYSVQPFSVLDPSSLGCFRKIPATNENFYLGVLCKRPFLLIASPVQFTGVCLIFGRISRLPAYSKSCVDSVFICKDPGIAARPGIWPGPAAMPFASATFRLYFSAPQLVFSQ